MATIAYTDGSVNNATAVASNNSRAGQIYNVAVVINVGKATALKGSALATGDVINAIDVPAGYLVTDVGVNVTVAEDQATALPLNVGDSGLSTRWVTTQSGTATGVAAGNAVGVTAVNASAFVLVTLGTVTGTSTTASKGTFTVFATLKPVAQATNAGTPTF